MQRYGISGNPIRLFVLTAGVCFVAFGAQSAVKPFEEESGFVAANPIDTLVLTELQKQGIEPANRCSDEVFVRRVFLDVIGTLPKPQEVQAFFQDTRPTKRAILIDALMKRDEFIDYWTMKWCDLLRVKAEFPINLWPNAVQVYQRWIHDAIRDNMPYDQFARSLLTSSGSNFRVGPANFYRALQNREPAGLAEAVALTFMGSRMATWPETQRSQMSAFFSRVAYKKTGEWKEEIVYLNPAPVGTVKMAFPDKTQVEVLPDQDPRVLFTNWLLTPGNPWFARNISNRVWSWLMGRGTIHEPDDIRPDNPPVNPKLLAYLENELINAHYDLHHLYRLILNSRTYQQSAIPRSSHAEVEQRFACYPVRRLDAEVLIDALNGILGSGERYSSPIPEPFEYVPEFQRTIALADGSISSSFLEMFGRPARDTGLESERNNQPTDAQRLHLLNSSVMQRKIESSSRLYKLIMEAQGDRTALIHTLYLCLLSRNPTQAELTAAEQYFQTDGLNFKQAEEDLVWALINTKEFLYRH